MEISYVSSQLAHGVRRQECLKFNSGGWPAANWYVHRIGRLLWIILAHHLYLLSPHAATQIQDYLLSCFYCRFVFFFYSIIIIKWRQLLLPPSYDITLHSGVTIALLRLQVIDRPFAPRSLWSLILIKALFCSGWMNSPLKTRQHSHFSSTATGWNFSGYTCSRHTRLEKRKKRFY